ncbi:hypothetical protein AB0H87_41780, partial [Asanoa sp. NPDC050611]
MNVVVWLAEGTWQACVDAAAEVAPASAAITLLHVTDPTLAEDVSDAYEGLLGRGTRGRDPGAAVGAAAAHAEEALLAGTTCAIWCESRVLTGTLRTSSASESCSSQNSCSP